MLQSSVRRGELDRDVTFIKKDLSIGASNADNIDAWVQVSTDPAVSARKRDLRGDVGVVAEQPSYSQRTVWTVDYREDIKPVENRLVYNTKVYEILGVSDTENSRGMYIDVMTSLLNNQLWT